MNGPAEPTPPPLAALPALQVERRYQPDLQRQVAALLVVLGPRQRLTAMVRDAEAVASVYLLDDQSDTQLGGPKPPLPAESGTARVAFDAAPRRPIEEPSAGDD